MEHVTRGRTCTLGTERGGKAMGKNLHYSKRYAKEQLKKKFEREGILASVGLRKNELAVRLYNKEDEAKVPKTFYGYPVENRVVIRITKQKS